MSNVSSKLLEFLELFLFSIVVGILRGNKNIPLLEQKSLRCVKQMSYSCVYLIVRALSFLF